ncbi:MarR family transcriptional regulator [uncultured Brevibacillus sp.]|uniref:MarR family transcriptional regulator n=1 Tax=uncultured Brevibacillus sp. TaxID=169970 RepID=UPI002595E069|nr:MarR family transcriptional regulator [uncultured Brevibacillus sp.]
MIVIVFVFVLYFLLLWLQPYIQNYADSVLSLSDNAFVVYKGYEIGALEMFIVASTLALLIGLPLQNKFNRRKSEVLMKLTFFNNLEDEDVLFVLNLARSKNGYVTAADIAARSSLTLNQSQKILNKLQEKGYADLSVAEAGDILYYFPGLHNIQQKKGEA